MTMSTMTSSFASLEAPATMQRNRSVWHQFFDLVNEAPARNTEHDIAEYLHRHQHHLAPEVRIALERHMRDHWR
jgi:hypothetical protein